MSRNNNYQAQGISKLMRKLDTGSSYGQNPVPQGGGNAYNIHGETDMNVERAKSDQALRLQRKITVDAIILKEKNFANALLLIDREIKRDKEQSDRQDETIRLQTNEKIRASHILTADHMEEIDHQLIFQRQKTENALNVEEKRKETAKKWMGTLDKYGELLIAIISAILFMGLAGLGCKLALHFNSLGMAAVCIALASIFVYVFHKDMISVFRSPI